MNLTVHLSRKKITLGILLALLNLAQLSPSAIAQEAGAQDINAQDTKPQEKGVQDTKPQDSKAQEKGNQAQDPVVQDPRVQETGAQALEDIVHKAKIVDYRIPLVIEITNHQAIVSLSVMRTTSTFELDSKNAALDISRSIMDADPEITSVLTQFKSAKSSEYNEVLVGGGEVSSYNAGRTSREQLLNSLELNAMILVDQPGSSDSKNNTKPESATLVDPTAKLKPSDGNAFALLPTDTSGDITSAIPIPAVGSDPYFEQTMRERLKSVPRPPGPPRPKDKYFCMGRVAFFYPPNWSPRAISKNFWATPDEQDLAELACKSKGGNPFLSLSRFNHITEDARLLNEAEVGNAFGLEVTTPETIKIGFGSMVVAKSILSTGRDGLIFFKRVYFKDGFDLYALTLKCKASEAPSLEPDFMRILSTIHAPRTDADNKKALSKDQKNDGAHSKNNGLGGKEKVQPGGLKLQPDIQNAPERKVSPDNPTKPDNPIKPDGPKAPDGLKTTPPAPRKDAELRARPTA